MPLLRLCRSHLVRLAFLAFLAAPALAQSSSAPPWDTFANLDDRPGTQVGVDAARLIFLRPVTRTDGPWPADILVNGRLLTALLPGGFAEVEVCPGKVRLELAGQGTNGLSIKPQATVDAPLRRTIYVLVQSPEAGNPLQGPLGEEQARALLPALKRQTHALSRVEPAKDCPAPVVAEVRPEPVAVPVPVAPRPAPAVQRFTLAAEMLFVFNGSRPQHLSQKGRAEIVGLAHQIKEQLQPSQQIVVHGHTDPMGATTLNQRLSQERAETIRQILITSGLPAHQLRAEGLGSSQLLVRDCERTAKNRDDKVQCNQPNRRVEVTVTSLKN